MSDPEAQQPMHYIVSYSGGASSWAAAKITQDRIMRPEDTMTLLFADTLIEDEDTYAFLEAGAATLGLPVTRIADGRTPLQVFEDVRFIGNSRVDPCSKILKRELLDKWIASQSDPKMRVLGLDWTEVNRFERFAARIDGDCIAPLIDFGIGKPQVLEMVVDAGLPSQRLYALGFPHANCGGACVKAGISQWTLLYRTFPERFAHWENEEERLGAKVGHNQVSILRDRRGGKTRPLPLRELRERIERQPQLLPTDEWGGCGCAVDG